MGKLIDEVSKALASGATRRGALAGLAASVAVALPWTSEAKKRRRRSKNKKKNTQPFAKFQELCDQWCDAKFGDLESAADACIDAAKNGKGPCYAEAEEGPGFYCLTKAGCAKEDACCPGLSVVLGEPVKDAECCPSGSTCLNAVNGTTGICL